MAWQDRSAWSLAVMPLFVTGTNLSHAVPRGACPWLSSVSQDKPSPANLGLGWLLAQDLELLLAGAWMQSLGVCKVLGWDSPWGHTRLPGVGGTEPEIALRPVHVQNHSGFTTGCSRVFVYPEGSFGIA